MSEQLADKKCVPCRGGVPPLKGKELEKLHQSVPKWMVYDEHHLHREFKFPDFKQALEFVNRVGALALNAQTDEPVPPRGSHGESHPGRSATIRLCQMGLNR